jgi:outer membrane protein assembly factor BamD (BamD/ComL family)
MRAGRYADAAAQYEALRRDFPSSPESYTVLVPLAQLELDRLGRPERALVQLDRYLASGPGALAQEARYARIRALAALGQSRQEAAAIEEFLRLHPASLRARHLEERLADLKRAR